LISCAITDPSGEINTIPDGFVLRSGVLVIRPGGVRPGVLVIRPGVFGIKPGVLVIRPGVFGIKPGVLVRPGEGASGCA
jgi:hypothetical protein